MTDKQIYRVWLAVVWFIPLLFLYSVFLESCRKKQSCYNCTVYYNDDQPKAGQIFTADQNICGNDHLDFVAKYGDMADSLNYECILMK